jgi:ubiquinone/menaquinone biosynthesis C-methylase UbiE
LHNKLRIEHDLIKVSIQLQTMSNSNFDPTGFKMSQQQSWDSVARGWQKWWKTIENGAQKINDRLIALAEIKPGHRVLDIATGIGEPAISAAKIVGKAGHVTATDISTGMLAIAEERARSLGLYEIMDFKQSDAEKLEFGTKQIFDSVLCRWGLMFLPDLDIALSNIQRVLAPRGKFATAVWSEPSKVPFISMPINTVRQETNASLPPQGIPGPFRLSDIDSLKKAFAKAGFTEVHSEPIKLVFEFNTAQDYTKFNQEIVAPIRIMLANETDERKEEIWNTVTKQAHLQFADNDSGHIKLENEAMCLVGSKNDKK